MHLGIIRKKWYLTMFKTSKQNGKKSDVLSNVSLDYFSKAKYTYISLL